MFELNLNLLEKPINMNWSQSQAKKRFKIAPGKLNAIKVAKFKPVALPNCLLNVNKC